MEAKILLNIAIDHASMANTVSNIKYKIVMFAVNDIW